MNLRTGVIYQGDCLEVIARELPSDSVDAVVTDPPYHLTTTKRFGPGQAPARSAIGKRLTGGFMGQQWDGGDIAFRPELWAEVLRVLKPGGHLVSFGGTRTYHRMACSIEDAGFEIRDSLQWLYGSGFPKSLDVSKAIDKAAGAAREVLVSGTPLKRMIPGADQHRDGWIKDDGREYVPTVSTPATAAAAQWQGWGTALKPACEPIVLARKPLSERSVAANVQRWGTGAINVDGCRVQFTSDGDEAESKGKNRHGEFGTEHGGNAVYGDYSRDVPRDNYDPPGRWPSNVLLDDEAARVLDGQSGSSTSTVGKSRGAEAGPGWGMTATGAEYSDTGGASRFFYTSKANSAERNVNQATRNSHPTVKPVDLMVWLVRLVTPPGGIVLDPFLGSGTTAIAATECGLPWIGIEKESAYVEIAQQRIGLICAVA